MIACWLFIASTVLLALIVVAAVVGGLLLAHGLRHSDPMDFLGRERLP